MSAAFLRETLASRLEEHRDVYSGALLAEQATEQQMRINQGKVLGLKLALEELDNAYRDLHG